MSSGAASGQRKALKALAKTPYFVFEYENTEVIVKNVPQKDVEEETKGAIKPNDKVVLSEDMSMNDQEGFQCGYCGDDHETWIQCENNTCKIQWYGLECMGLVEAPAGRWICAMCRPRPVFPNFDGAPKVLKQDDPQQKHKGIASRKKNPNKTRPGWKGWVEVTDEVKEKLQQEVDAQWEVAALPKRTRTNPDSDENKHKRRLRGQQKRTDRVLRPAKYKKSQRPSITEPSTDDDQLAQEPAAALSHQGRLPTSKSLLHPDDGDFSDDDIEGIDDGVGSQYDRESTFEGFSEPEEADNFGSSLEETGFVDENEEAGSLSSGDPSADEVSDADEDQDLEMADEIESDLDELSLVDEEEGPENLFSGDHLGDEVSNFGDGIGPEPRDFGMGTLTEVDVRGGTTMETLGVGATDYTYLNLSRYGPYLVRRS